MLDGKEILNMIKNPKKHYKPLKSPTGDIRTVESIFVDEGFIEGGIKGQKSNNIEFAFSDEDTLNKAVVIPLTKRAHSDELLAGVVTEFLPVPERYKGTGLSINVPSFTLPKEIKSIDDAKEFVAKKFKVKPEQVARFGESYFNHIGVTPLRIFPFVVTASKKMENPQGGPIQLAPLTYIGWLFGCLDKDDFCFSNMTLDIFKKLRRNMGPGNEHSRQFSKAKTAGYDLGYRPTVIQGSIAPPEPSLDNMPDISHHQPTDSRPLTSTSTQASSVDGMTTTTDAAESITTETVQKTVSNSNSSDSEIAEVTDKLDKLETDLKALRKHALDRSLKYD
jgi:hypothetical protein